MQQHVLDDRIRSLAVLLNLIEVAAQGACEFIHLSMDLLVELHALQRLSQFIDQFTGKG